MSVCLTIAAAALMATGCCVSSPRSGDCCAVPSRCSTQFQDRCVNGFMRPFAPMRGASCDGGCACDSGAAGCDACGAGVGGCGCDRDVSGGCGCDACGGAGGSTMGGGLLRGRLGGGLMGSGGSSCGCAMGDGCATGNCGAGAGGMGAGGMGDGYAMGSYGMGAGGMGAGGMGGMGANGGLNLPLLGGGNGMGSGVATVGYQDGLGCGHFGCGSNGKLCLSCRLKNMIHGRGGHHHGLGGHSMAANQPYGGMIPHTEPIPSTMGGEGMAPTYAYPYYTTRGPRDFLQSACGPPPIYPNGSARSCLPTIGY